MKIVTQDQVDAKTRIKDGERLIGKARCAVANVEVQGRVPAAIIVSDDEKRAIREYLLDLFKSFPPGGHDDRIARTRECSVDGYPILTQAEWDAI